MTTTGGKAARTRARLTDAAFELFAEQGYDATTVAQIAERVGVTEMTFYRHFGSKDAVVVGDPYDPLIAAAVAAQPTDLPPLVRAARGVRSAWEGQPLDDDEALRARVSLGAATPSLRPAIRAGTAATEAAIAEALAAGGTDPLDAAVCAAALLGALTTALLGWPARPGTTLGATILRALDLLEHRP
ncbi:MAG: TetR/AcrR family transcriptional regulator [Cellulomonas sp.]|uniref:TetR/AcrR family transcriptional regulator n=1 Tax=Cellulomonas sp. 73-92 TaxID=1895740 RepID=UPI000929381D|nr:TetR/AcrR family transcriptional regulator [Cellulomonas sp. 73-92]MBN9375160.1 TetR/AcrR family transcriptional regulator [Cellulomonas sp.]OJV78976.1 MAG: TetR family transcriptional regulator [Cellulomonas sp. 73-92]